jgi:glycerol-3-phosphate cytidylyltransferase
MNERGQRIVGYVPGAWDMFHIGHLNILKRAREQCDYLIAGVVTDDVLYEAKGKHPIVPLDERMDIVQSLDLVDEVVIDWSSDKMEAWRQLHFNLIFKGDDWKDTPKGQRLERDLGAVGVRVCYFPYTVHTSSSLLRTLITDHARRLRPS